ncbi:hypothetical protein EYV94_03665 [Puteibacter caeruleilacunae]|nr:hypothetical protein EYV94_03665 [Puteibacter caeruleilacunae]
MEQICSILLASVGSAGFTVTIVGFSIVAVSLAALVVVFSQVPKIINLKIRSKLKKEGKEVEKTEEISEMEGNVNAAIGMALYLYFNELHDEESNIITIKKTRKAYSPWSSKIYGVSNWPQK